MNWNRKNKNINTNYQKLQQKLNKFKIKTDNLHIQK